MPSSRSTILVIDDDPDLRGSLADILRDAGYVVATAHDGASALVLLHTVTADLILVDLRMPTMNGLEFLERWSVEPRSGAAVVLMSGDDHVGAPPAGTVATLAKPFSADQLLEMTARFAPV